MGRAKAKSRGLCPRSAEAVGRPRPGEGTYGLLEQTPPKREIWAAGGGDGSFWEDATPEGVLGSTLKAGAGDTAERRTGGD